jgi:hypothetical protein
MLTVENRTGEVAKELLEKVRLLTRDFIEAVALATLLNIGSGQTASQLSVEICHSKLALCFQ